MGENGIEPSTPVLSEEQRVEVRRRLDCYFAVAIVPLTAARQDADDQIKDKDKLARSRISLLRLAAWLGAVLVLVFGIGQAQAAGAPASVDSQRIINADRDVANWLSYGRTYSEQRFSPLSKINADNAKQLGLAWYADLDTNRGQQATPLVIDGAMYVSTAWSMVKAYDAATGKLLWSYDPEVPRERGVKGCCDVVNRGVAAWKGKIYVGNQYGDAHSWRA